MGCLITLLCFLLVAALEYLLTAGIIYLITLCFSLAFSWKIATGIWLVFVLLTGIFGGKKK